MNESENEKTILAELQFRLMQPCNGVEACELAAEAIRRIAGDVIVAASIVDESELTMRAVALKGLDVSVQKIIGISGMDIGSKSIELAEMTPDELRACRSERLEKIDGGTISLVARFIPKPVCDLAERLMRLTTVYAMGFIYGQELLGSLFLFCRDEIPTSIENIERIVSIAAIAMQRSRTETKLRASEKRYRNLFEGSAVPLIVEDYSEVKTHFDKLAAAGVQNWKAYFEGHPSETVACASKITKIDFNQTCVFFFGASSREELTRNLPSYFVEETWPVFRDILIALAQGQTRFTGEITMKNIAGEKCKLAITLQVSPGCEKTLEKVIVSFSDLSGRKIAEEARRASEEKFRSYVEHAPDPVMVVDDTGRFMEINPASCRMTGYSPEELLRMSISDLLSEESIEAGMRHFNKVKESGAASDDLWHRRKDGVQICLTVDSVKLSDSRVMEFMKDVTDRVRAYRAIHENEMHLRSILANTNAGYFFIDAEGIIREVNDGWIRLYKYGSREEVLGKHFSVIQRLEDRAMADEFVKGIMAGDERYCSGEFSRRCKDGTIGWHTFSAMPAVRSDKIVGIEGLIIDITARKKAEETTLESERKFRSLFECMNEGVALHELIYAEDGTAVDYRIVDVNPMFETHTGIAATKAKGRLATEVYKTGTPPFMATYERVARTGEPFSFEIFFPPLGKTFLISVFSPKGGWFATVFNDITERINSDKKLRESERRYRTIADFTYDWETWIAPSGQVLYCSPSVLRITGYSAEEIVQDPGLLLAMVHPEDRGIMEHHYKEELSDVNRSFNFDYRIINAQGQTRWVSHYCVPVHDENHAHLGRRGSTRDITKRKKMEDSLAESERRLRQLFEQTGTANALFDRDCRLILQNSMSKDLLNAGADTIIGKSALEIFGTEAGREVTERMLRVMETGNPETFETLFNLPIGQKWFRSAYQPLLDPDEKVSGVQVIFQDITELKKISEIAQRSDKLESLGLLAGGIAHDFNNLLGGIYGYIDMAQDKVEPGSKGAEYLKKAVKTFERARDLTQQLLTFSKGGVPDKKPGALGPLLQEGTHFALSGSKVSASFDIASDLWICDFDENQLGQVVNNIVLNASQAMPDGGKVIVSAVNVDLRVGGSTQLKPGPYIKIAIHDTGPGIPPSVLPRIFDPFFTTKPKGNGLGLATSYSIIKKHDGELSVDSVPGKGATFTLYLPASAKSVSAASGSESAASHKGTGAILVMDDEESIRETVGDMLKGMGYKVVFAQNGAEALAKVKSAARRKRPFRAIFMDLTIPGEMGGREATEELRKTDTTTPVFVASGYSDDPVMADPARYGFTGMIKKPFRKSHLAGLLAENLR